MLTPYMKNNTGFEACSPEEVGITSASVISFFEETKRRGMNIHSFMLLRHGKVAAQGWSHPYAPQRPCHLYSFSKSVAATAVGFAIAEGLLSEKSRVAGFFPRRIGENADPRLYSMTVGHLLNMTSGAVLFNEATMNLHSDWVEHFLNAPLLSFPGDKFVYNSLNTYMLSAILRRVTGVGLVDYLMPRLFEPLGIERPEWLCCPLGIECGGWGLSLKTEDMAKLCQLYLDDGVWRGVRLLPEGWAAAAGANHADTSTDDKFSDNIHNRSGYGYQFWLNAGGDSYRADGMFGQYGIIMPEKDVVIIVTAGVPEQIRVLDVLWDTVIPAIDSIPEGTAPGGDYAELCAVCGGLAQERPVGCMRRRVRERSISHKKYAFPMNSASMLPLAVRYLECLPMLGIDWMQFDFGDDVSSILWYEDGEEHRLDFSFDGKHTAGVIGIGKRQMPVEVYAAWLTEKRLELDICLIQTPHTVRAVFSFEGESATVVFDETPSIKDSMKMLAGLTSLTRTRSERFAVVMGKILQPLTGTVSEE